MINDPRSIRVSKLEGETEMATTKCINGHQRRMLPMVGEAGVRWIARREKEVKGQWIGAIGDRGP